MHTCALKKKKTGNSQNALREFHDMHLLEVAGELCEQIKWPAEQRAPCVCTSTVVACQRYSFFLIVKGSGDIIPTLSNSLSHFSYSAAVFSLEI